MRLLSLSLWKLLLLAALLLSTVLLLSSSSVMAQQEDGEAEVEDVGEEEEDDAPRVVIPTGTEGEQDDDDDDDEDDEAETIPPVVTHLFPDAPLGNLMSGTYATILIGFTNVAESDVIVHTIEGSFRYPLDYSQILQNFTTYKYEVIIPPMQQATINYRWGIPPVFEPRELGLTILATCEDSSGNAYKIVSFNGTVIVVDPIHTFDLQGIFLLIISVAFIAGIGYVIYNYFFRSKGTKRESKVRTPAPVETGTTAPKTVDESFIPRHVLDSLKQRKK